MLLFPLLLFLRRRRRCRFLLTGHARFSQDDESAADKFKEATEAYEVLSDDDQRVRHTDLAQRHWFR